MVFVKFYYAVSLGVGNRISKDTASFYIGLTFQKLREPRTVENIITQNKGYRIFTYEFFSENKRLCKPIW